MGESSNTEDQPAFAKALLRAKIIAARINPGASASSTNQAQKRPLEDYEESARKKMARRMEEGESSQASSSYVGNLREPNKLTPKVIRSMVMIPSSKVGLIIGKGGETIKELQEKSGAKLFIVQNGCDTSDEKTLRVSGEPHKVEYAKQLVKEILDRNKNGDPNQDDSTQQYEYGRNCQIEVVVPKPAVGLVIGKGGEKIRSIQSETGAKVQFHQAKMEGLADRRCYISGNHQNVEYARQKVLDIIASVCPERINGTGDEKEFTFIVPFSKCGLVIGKQGEYIKKIISQAGAHCELDKSYKGKEDDRLFIIRGDEKQIKTAQKMISNKIEMRIDLIPTCTANNNLQAAYPAVAEFYQNSYFYPSYEQQWGGAPNQIGHVDAIPMSMQYQNGGSAQALSVQQNVACGAVTDYSSYLWIDYYRRLGLFQKANEIAQYCEQLKNTPIQ